ncbi:MAG TPA: hypothetical protein VKY74_23890 [Chloroflexia bacterium]|nr:hypothetical protein [Chloroflexia bacterium]
MSRARLVGTLGALALAFGLLACEDPTPIPTPPPAGPTATPTVFRTATPTATATNTPLPTATPVPTATEGAVRTPVGGAAGPEFMTALAAMDQAPTYRYKLQLVLGPADARYVLTGTGAYQPVGNYDTNYNALGFNSEIAVISATTYVRTYGIWHRGDPDATTFPLGAPPNIPRLIGLLSYAVDASLVGDGNETLDGHAARHFRFILRTGGLFGPGGPNLGTAGGDLWSDPTTHRYQRLSLTFGRPGTPTDNDGALQLDFADYGSALTLTPPPVAGGP